MELPLRPRKKVTPSRGRLSTGGLFVLTCPYRDCQATCKRSRQLHSLAALNNRDFVVWAGHFVSLLSVIGGWGGVLPPHFGQKKSRRPFSDFLLGVPL